MSALVHLKIFSERAEDFHSLPEKLTALNYTYSFHATIEELCDSLAHEPADAVIVHALEMSQSTASQIQKKISPPQIIVYLPDKKIPNYVKVIAPFCIQAESNREEISYVVDSAVSALRKGRRLLALRTHQKRGWNFEYNPALHLITSLVKKCTISEDFPDLLNAMLTFKNVIEFQDSSLILLDHRNKVLQILHAPAEKSENIVQLHVDADFPAQNFDFLEPKTISFNSSQEWDHPLGKYTKNPWGSAIAIGFCAEEAPKRKGIARSAMLVLYRRDLIPFTERDLWLLEMTYGPLALALEKVAMLKAIGQASKEWRSTFDAISEPLTVVDNDFQISKANKAFAKLIGQDIKKIKGKKCHQLLANRRTPCPSCPALLDEVPSSGVRLASQGKEKRDLLAWSYGIRTPLESYHFQFYRDVSKETALTGALIQSEKMAAVGRLVGAIAHEINNPIAGILATSQIILSEPSSSDPSLQEDMKEIRDAAWRSKKIIDDLLGFTEGEGKGFERADLADIVRSSLTFSRSALGEIKVSNTVESLSLVTSPNSLQQVLFNLITNAAQAMNGRGALVLSSKSSGDFISLSVEDSGPGIASDRLEHIFDPFYTSKQEGSGTGLGLSIVKNLAAKIGIKISVESALGSGTKFHLKIPMKDIHA